MKHIVISIPFLFLFYNCSFERSYDITTDKISSNKFIKNGFYLSKISVSNFDQDGKPTAFSKIETVYCGPLKNFSVYLYKSTLSKKEIKLVERNKMVMDSIMELNGNQLGGKEHEEGIMEYISSKKIIDSIEEKYFSFKPQKSISLEKENKQYRWIFTKKSQGSMDFYDYSKGLYERFPLELEENQWYFINFSNASNIIDKLFFKIFSNGDIVKFHDNYTIFGV